MTKFHGSLPPRVRRLLVWQTALLALVAGGVQGDDTKTSAGIEREFVHQGISVKLAIEPVAGQKESGGKIEEGENVAVTFRLTDTNSGKPLTGSRPAVWIDSREERQPLDEQGCKQRIESLVGGGLGDRAQIDLNTYYVLALNDDATISVVDPLFGYGGSKLLAMVWLRTPGEDWALDSNGSRLFVSMPQSNQVAVASTAAWNVFKNIDVGMRPARVALQPDGKYLWVGCDGEGAESGVTVIDTGTLQAVARIPTGAGHHEIAFTDDNLHAFVTNRDAGTLTVIDVQKLTRGRQIETGKLPVSVAYSATSNAVYVSNQGDGVVAVIDGRRLELVARIKSRPGLGMIRFAPGGRLGFVVNEKKSVVHIIDAATNRIVQTGDVGREPDQISFTENLAYVRSKWSTDVMMIPLTQVGKPGPVPIVDFTGGQVAFGKASKTSLAGAIVPAPEGGAVLVANPVDKMIYYYKEGMAAPMGSFVNPERQPRALLVVDRSIRETEPGTYTSMTRLTRSGNYSVVLYNDSPRMTHCFDISVAPNPLLKKPETVALEIEPLVNGQTLTAGEPFRLRFKVRDTETRQPAPALRDVGVLTFLTPGTWQQRSWATPVGDGVYESTLTPPKAGIYFVFWECPSRHVPYNKLPYIVLQAAASAPVTSENRPPRQPGVERP